MRITMKFLAGAVLAVAVVFVLIGDAVLGLCERFGDKLDGE